MDEKEDSTNSEGDDSLSCSQDQSEEGDTSVRVISGALSGIFLDDRCKISSSLEDITNEIAKGRCKRVVVLCGAGLSTPCGIPDFRSPKTSIFENLKKYDLPFPEALFHIDFFRENPKPFVEFSRTVLSSITNAKPSLAHHFIKLLADKKLLVRVYTQNVDGLEELAGIDKSLLCCAHGSLKTAHCIVCHADADITSVHTSIRAGEVPVCSHCDGVVKPDVVFYGEQLPERFHECLALDKDNIDLLLVMGTSLTVAPVSLVPRIVSQRASRLLINNTVIPLFHVNSTDPAVTIGRKDVFFEGSCDSGCKRMAELLGWEKELLSLASDD